MKKLSAGRPKLEIERKKQLNVRLSEQEFADLEFLMQKYKLNKVEAIVKAIKNLKTNPPKKIRSQMPNFKPQKIPKQSEGVIDEGEIIWFDKPRKQKTAVKKISG